MLPILPYVGLAGFVLSALHWLYELYRYRPRVRVLEADAYSHILNKGTPSFSFTLILSVHNPSDAPVHISAAALSTSWEGRDGNWFPVPLDEHGRFPIAPFQADHQASELQDFLAPYAALPCTVPSRGLSRIACVFLSRSSTQLQIDWLDLYQDWMDRQERLKDQADQEKPDIYQAYFEEDSQHAPYLTGLLSLPIQGYLWSGKKRRRFSVNARVRKMDDLGTAFD